MFLYKLKAQKRGFSLVELMIVVAIIGILAALAIPAFLRYIRSSKAAEADGIMRKMADGASTYFSSEQRNCGGEATCDQPWHNTSTERRNIGLPVPWSVYVFPGGATGAGNFVSMTDVPIGGSKAFNTIDASASPIQRATMNKLNTSFGDPTYFQYEYVSTGVAGGAEADIFARARFKSSTAAGQEHTARQFVTVDAASQEPIVGAVVVNNEFQ